MTWKKPLTQLIITINKKQSMDNCGPRSGVAARAVDELPGYAVAGVADVGHYDIVEAGPEG